MAVHTKTIEERGFQNWNLFWVQSMRIWAKKSSEDSLVTKMYLRFQSLVWTAKYDVETLVWTQIFLSVFWNPEVFEKALMWAGSK